MKNILNSLTLTCFNIGETTMADGYCEMLKKHSDNNYFINAFVLYSELGKAGLEKKIKEIISEKNITHIFLFNREFVFDINFLRYLSDKTFLTMFFFDTEYWFEPIERYYAQVADLVVLPDYLAKFQYTLFNMEAICSFPLYSKECYKKRSLLQDIDVSFVGRIKSGRKEGIDFLKKHHIQVESYGTGTKNGFVSFDQMIDVFNRSKINLNFTEIDIDRKAVLYKNINKRVKQIKGRPVETALCGGFVLSEYAPGIEQMFNIGEEIDVFHDKNELLEKVSFYLKNEDIRNKMAKKAQERALNEYDINPGFERVFKIINELGLKPKKKKIVYLDDDFVKNYAAYRVKFIISFLWKGKIKFALEEFAQIFKSRKISFRTTFFYIKVWVYFKFPKLVKFLKRGKKYD